jgi:UDP-N-acetylglucosamine--N-acetylmuramyl-(pentapeptide) pyrophosphoryl-undecaprenol N-acetylglucosamine transferase
MTSTTGMRIIVTGGGTGGHTYPALTTIRALQARLAVTGRQAEVLWVGVSHGLEARIAAAEQIGFRAVTTGKLRRSPNRREVVANLADLVRIPLGILQATAAVARFRPVVVFSTGGYVAVPVGMAAWLLRVPLVIHEQTLGVGLANRILARVADRVLLSHSSSAECLPARARARAVVTGNPVRPELLAGDPCRGRARYGFEAGVPLVVVTGGAQGAMQINRLVAAVLPELLPHCQVLHQTGAHGAAFMREAAGSLPPGLAGRYRPVDYLHTELPDVLAAADLVVARAGAGTVTELTALGKPAVLIPLIPTGGDEQRVSARRLTDAGAARMLAGADATPQRLREDILALLGDPAARRQMGEAAARQGRPDAAEQVVTALLYAARPEPVTAR